MRKRPINYHQAILRAEYYRWAATRGHTLPGNDPVMGTPRSGKYGQPGRVIAEMESRVAYKAMARFWLSEAGRIRRKNQKDPESTPGPVETV